MKRMVLLAVAMFVSMMVVSAAFAAGPSLTLGKTSFNPGESISVKYKTPSNYASNAWIGIIPSGIKHGKESLNDQHDITYKYLNNSTAGTLTFQAPTKPGSYDFRMHDTDNDGVEVASVTFTVGGPGAPTSSKYNVGDAVMVEWNGKWYPSHVIAADKNKWKINYDGWESSWDEWVTDARIKSK
jgi:hypothetical protein